MRLLALIFLLAALSPVTFLAATPATAAVWERSLPALQSGLKSGQFSAESLTRSYLERIRRMNPVLHAVIAINPEALAMARRSDARRTAGQTASALDGIPILVKDNIDVAGLATTAGSLALVDNVATRDALLVQRLKEAGLVILGKANMSEWANFRSSHATSGWSAVGGLTRNPYALDRTACGSSSGSAVAVAADLAPLAVGTETDGSITCPAAMNGLVGLKPTVGWVSRAGIVPISHTQDTAGPMARTVSDAAALFSILADAASVSANTPATASWLDDRTALAAGSLRGVRIGVLRFFKNFSPRTLAVFETALGTLRAQGAVLVDIERFDFAELGAEEKTILLTEFKMDLNDYLNQAPTAVATRSLASVIEFNKIQPSELTWFDQDLFERAAQTTGLEDPIYLDALRKAHQQAGPEGIDRLLRENRVELLVAPTVGPAWSIDWVNGDPSGAAAGKLSAVAGYPHLTVPMGQVAGLPLGISFIGPAWSDFLLLSLGISFESAVHARRPPSLSMGRLPPRLGP